MLRFCKEVLKEWKNETIFFKKLENASNENQKSRSIQYKHCPHRKIEEISHNIYAIPVEQKPMNHSGKVIVCCIAIVSSEFLCLLIPCKHYITVNKLSLSLFLSLSYPILNTASLYLFHEIYKVMEQWNYCQKIFGK